MNSIMDDESRWASRREHRRYQMRRALFCQTHAAWLSAIVRERIEEGDISEDVIDLQNGAAGWYREARNCAERAGHG